MNSEPAPKGRQRSALFVFAAVSIAVMASRIPFLSAGYGVDPDAWRLINAAVAIGETGRYMASRLPGYPIPEYSYSVVHDLGPIAVNGLVALLSAVAAGFFALTLRALGSRRYILASLAFAFVPIVYANSVCAMDYIWGLAFGMISLYAVVRGRPLQSGIMLGLAVGCRLTCLAMILPFSIILFYNVDRKRVVRDIAAFVVPTILLGGMSYLPVISSHGLGFLCFCDNIKVPHAMVLKRATIDLWGVVGAAAFLAVLIGRHRPPGIVLDSPRRAGAAAACAVAICIYFAAFLRLPHEAAYLIPAIPFALILLDMTLPPVQFAVFCVLISLSSFVDIGLGGISPGAMLRQHMNRINGMKFVDRVIERSDSLPAGTAVVAGPWQPQIVTETRERRSRSSINYLYVLTRSDVRRLKARQLGYYFLPTEENDTPILDVRPFHEKNLGN